LRKHRSSDGRQQKASNFKINFSQFLNVVVVVVLLLVKHEYPQHQKSVHSMLVGGELDSRTANSERATSRDRCYDLKNIFAEKFSKNIGVFCSNYC
jgi:hypothetical protein